MLTQLGVEAADRARPQRRPLAALPAAVDADATTGWGRSRSPLKADEGYAELVAPLAGDLRPGHRRRPGLVAGRDQGAVTRALADVGAVEVALDGGAAGWVLPDDLEPEARAEPWAALLPVLDPTVMGWKERGFYLGPHGPTLFDRNGNAGTTAWWDGRIVGCWVQDPDGVVARRPARGRRRRRRAPRSTPRRRG